MQEETSTATAESGASDADLELFADFAQECDPKITDLEDLVLSLENDPGNLETPKEIYRILHTIKGTAASVGLTNMAKFSHGFEDFVVPIREGKVKALPSHSNKMLAGIEHLKNAMTDLKSGKVPQLNEKFWLEEEKASPTADPKAPAGAAKQTQRSLTVEIGLVDVLMANSGNIMVIKDLILQEMSAASNASPHDAFLKRGMKLLDELGKQNDLLQKSIGALRKTKISGALRAPQRAIRDLALQLGKQVKLEMNGTNCAVDCDIAQTLGDCLVHIVRNAIDHGIEMPDERARKNKAPEATIGISISLLNDDVIIEVKDDGKGIDVERIKKKALTNNVVSEEQIAGMSKEAILGLIFESGFSTAEKVTEISGRGVGLDMVMKAITQLKGRIVVGSEIDRGSTFTIVIPERKVTNISSALIGKRGSHHFAVPRDQVIEIKSFAHFKEWKRYFENEHGCAVHYNGRYLNVIDPVIESSELVHRDHELVLILDDGQRAEAVLMEQVFSLDNVIVKDMPMDAPNLSGFEKVAISGRFGLILYLDLAILQKFRNLEPVPRDHKELGLEL